MRRGDIWTIAGWDPRPVVIVQDDTFDATDSVTICAFTTDRIEAPLFRIPVKPSAHNRLGVFSCVMVDRITTVAKSHLGKRVGRLDDEVIPKLNQAILVFLGLAASPKGKLRR